MIHFKTRFLQFLEKNLGLAPRNRETMNILDRSYTVLAGSVRTDDYDDAWLLALGLNSKVVFDIGCNIGQSSLLTLYSPTIQQIVLVDPNPAALSVGAENLITYGFSIKSRFVCAFASDKDDEKIEFFTVGAGAAGSMFRTHAVTAGDLDSSTLVPTLTIDSLSEKLSLVPDLVKLDVEGAERLALAGATKIASKQATSFMVEMHSSPEMSMATNGQSVLTWCQDNGYKAWYLKDKVELKSVGQIEDRGRCHLLLLPGAAAFPEYLRHLEQGAKLEQVKR
ncbi:MAG TPA: FkbM family methyltransferase [Verrucomicrobiae bacterium]|nr:FkbM family methyltransferase [Verrucomicrobiae bacterium]